MYASACDNNPSSGGLPPGFGPSASSSAVATPPVASPTPDCSAPGAILQYPACVVIPSPVACTQPTGASLYSGTSSGILWSSPPFAPTQNFCSITVRWSAKCFSCGSGYVLEVVSYPGQEIVVASARAFNVTQGASGQIIVEHTDVPAGAQLFLRAGGDGNPNCHPSSDYECMAWTVSVSE